MTPDFILRQHVQPGAGECGRLAGAGMGTVAGTWLEGGGEDAKLTVKPSYQTLKKRANAYNQLDQRY